MVRHVCSTPCLLPTPCYPAWPPTLFIRFHSQCLLTVSKKVILPLRMEIASSEDAQKKDTPEGMKMLPKRLQHALSNGSSSEIRVSLPPAPTHNTWKREHSPICLHSGVLAYSSGCYFIDILNVKLLWSESYLYKQASNKDSTVCRKMSDCPCLSQCQKVSLPRSALQWALFWQGFCSIPLQILKLRNIDLWMWPDCE